MKHHIETGGGQLPAKLSSLFIKVSGGSLACEKDPRPENTGSVLVNWLCLGDLQTLGSGTEWFFVLFSLEECLTSCQILK